MGKRKRKQTTQVVHEHPTSSPFWMLLKEVGAKIRPRSGNVLMVLTFAHLLIGLAFLGIVASHYSASDSAAFGMEVSEAEAQRRASIDTSRSPVSSTATTSSRRPLTMLTECR